MDGLELTLTLALVPTGQTRVEAGARHFTRSGGEPVALREGWSALRSVEVLPCAAQALQGRPAPRRWRWPSPLDALVGTAHAHERTLPTRLGTPHVAGLPREDGEERTLGTLHPPPARYCSARLVFGPADADAEGVEAAGPGMVGRSLRLEGTLGSAAAPLLLESRSVELVEVALPTPLELSEETPRGTVQLRLAYDRWLEGVDVTAEGAGEQALRAVALSATALTR